MRVVSLTPSVEGWPLTVTACCVARLAVWLPLLLSCNGWLLLVTACRCCGQPVRALTGSPRLPPLVPAAGSLLAFECLSDKLGRLFEPYVIQILPMLLVCFGDGNQVGGAA